jgi:enamine deaminase RidA (YjgF/YER057c/UK114 family)
VKVSIWLQDPRDFAGYNKVYAEFFLTDPPTRSTVSANLIFDFKVEIEVVAYRPES